MPPLPSLEAERDDFVSQGNYSLQAKNISFLSDSAEPGGSDINLMARGSGPAAGGSVNVAASRQINLQCGPTILGLLQGATENSIILANGTSGNIMLAQGSTPGSPQLQLQGGMASAIQLSVGLPLVGSALELKPDGLSLRFGPPVGGASLDMNSQGVTIKFAAWSLKMDTMGIELSVGPNQVKVAPQGVSVNGITVAANATTKMSLQGLQVSLQALGMLQAGAPLTMIG